jgi:hypothetical protein
LKYFVLSLDGVEQDYCQNVSWTKRSEEKKVFRTGGKRERSVSREDEEVYVRNMFLILIKIISNP